MAEMWDWLFYPKKSVDNQPMILQKDKTSIWFIIKNKVWNQMFCLQFDLSTNRSLNTIKFTITPLLFKNVTGLFFNNKTLLKMISNYNGDVGF
jgi:hypothetical protein